MLKRSLLNTLSLPLHNTLLLLLLNTLLLLLLLVNTYIP
jgi:hypothetical protein